jgi:hypothetical protein
MPVSEITPVVLAQPRAARWSLVALGAGDTFDVGHNATFVYVVVAGRDGAGTLSIEASVDGTNWYEVPELKDIQVEANLVWHKKVEVSVASVRPVVKDISTQTFSVDVYIVTGR